ncbi:MAG: adenosylhomocysteinase [Oscillospiraceae bacterium]|nr:adenosylhomocysteinase [Oscillospiraceae bacterium]
MSRIKDINLAKTGYEKIEWVKSYMPVLNLIEKDFAEKKPFAGKKISMSIHLEAKTAYLAHVLRAGGAEVFVTGCNPLSTRDDVAASLVNDGFEVNAVHGASMREYEEHLIAALSCRPDLMIDDGGDFTNLLHGPKPELAKNLIGGCEETTTGIHRLKSLQKSGKLRFPMINVNDADCKHLFDNRYGTGQSTFDGIMHTTNLIIAGQTVVVAGYGWCGRGIAMRAKGMGAIVVVTEIDYVKAIEARMDGFAVMPMSEAAKLGDLFITVTGCNDVISEEHFKVMKDGAVMCNSGHFDVEIDKKALSVMSVEITERKENITGYKMPDGRILNLLAEGRLVNLAAGNGHPAEIMDMSFAIQAKSLEYLAGTSKANNHLQPALYNVPKDIDREIAALKLASMGAEIDALTEEQKKYMDVEV